MNKQLFSKVLENRNAPHLLRPDFLFLLGFKQLGLSDFGFFVDLILKNIQTFVRTRLILSK